MLRNRKIIKLNFLLKIVTVLFIFCFSNSWGQASLPVSRTAWGTTPADWIDSGTGSYLTTFACSGSNGGQLNSTGDFYQVFYNGPASNLSFVTKSTAAFTGTFDVQESANGSVWTTVQSYTSMSTSCVTNNLTLNCSSRYVRFFYTLRNQNITIDDVSITQGTCPSCTPPATTISPTTQTICAGSVTTISVTSSATSPSYTWQTSANGTTGWTNVVNGTPSGASYSGTNTAVLTLTAGSTYYYRCLVAEGGTCTATSSTSTLVVNTISITSQPISVSTTSTGTASYSVTVLGSGLLYQWQQNSGSGFSNISNGGTNPTYAGATTSVLTISNPPMSMSGYSYQCIVSNSCGTITTNGTATLTVTASLTCPSITGALINACDDAGCAEGNNELLFLNSGSYSIPVNSTNINITFNGTNFTGSFTPDAALTASLNASAGCSLFTDASSGTIPANSTFIMMNDDVCLNYDFSSYCSAAPIYVIYSSGAWNSSGFFTNTGSGIRSWVTNFSAISATCPNATYSYIPDNLTTYAGSGNGASVTFDNAANPTYVNNGCTPPSLILPIELLDFYATQNGSANDLLWKVASEKNVSQYIIEKSEEGVHFSELARINAIGTEAYPLTYSCEDPDPFTGITYYRLSTLENNQTINHHKIIDLDRGNKDWKSLIYQENDQLIVDWKNYVPNDASVVLFDLSGKQLANQNVFTSQTRINTNGFAGGIYFVRISTPYKTENFKIVIQR